MKRKYTGTAMQAQIKLAGIVIVIALVFGIVTDSCGQWGGKAISEYTAANGITYHIGDVITLSKGTSDNQTFASVLERTDAFNEPEGEANAPKYFAGYKATIKKIRKEPSHVYFVTKIPRGGTYTILIEHAIERCEITDCKKQ
jgi:hypothetical protein